MVWLYTSTSSPWSLEIHHSAPVKSTFATCHPIIWFSTFFVLILSDTASVSSFHQLKGCLLAVLLPLLLLLLLLLLLPPPPFFFLFSFFIFLFFNILTIFFYFYFWKMFESPLYIINQFKTRKKCDFFFWKKKKRNAVGTMIMIRMKGCVC